MPNEKSSWTRAGSALDRVNDAFHGAYEGARGAEEEAAPVLILLGDTLVLHAHGERREFPVTPRSYHALRSAAHAPVALYALLYRGPALLDAPLRRRVEALLQSVTAATASLNQDVEEEAVAADIQKVLSETLETLHRLLHEGGTSRQALEGFARARGPELLRLTNHATRLELETLSARVEAVLEGLTEPERNALHVIVAGAHQARERSVGMQYFRARLGEPGGEEERVAYAENVADEAGALELVGTRRMDRDIAKAFFGDSKRLQRDILGDAATAHLRRRATAGEGTAA